MRRFLWKQHWAVMSSWLRNTRLERPLSRMNCQTFSRTFRSGHSGGSGSRVMLAGTAAWWERCPPPDRAAAQRAVLAAPRRCSWPDAGSCSRCCGRAGPGCALALAGADGAEDGGGRLAQVLRSRRSGGALCPSAGNLVLLANPGLVGERYPYRIEADALVLGDTRRRGEDVSSAGCGKTHEEAKKGRGALPHRRQLYACGWESVCDSWRGCSTHRSSISSGRRWCRACRR